MGLLFDIHPDEYIKNTKLLNAWHKNMQTQLVLSSFWICGSFLFLSTNIYQSYRRAQGPYSVTLLILLLLICALSALTQFMYWRRKELSRTYTLSITKDLLKACKRRTVLRLALFIVYMITYILIMTTAYLFFNSLSYTLAVTLLVDTAPLTIALNCLCIYNAFRCKQHLRRFDRLLVQLVSQEN